MYEYSHDPETGGLLLNDRAATASKEPRPVYAPELDALGLDLHWNYSKQTDAPYLWAEANRYYYREKYVFCTVGGGLFQKPGVEFVYEKDEKGVQTDRRVLPDGTKLERVDLKAMVAKNRDMINVIEQTTVKKIYDYYRRMQNRLDCFHVAFSGGKDSVVLLELVKRALPKSSFHVVFGDTKMEFPDTYQLVDQVEKECEAQGIQFYRAESHLVPEKSWRIFGPPSRVLRWCCSVHKAAPQTLKIREIIGKSDYVGADFVGVRAFESDRRAQYDEESFGMKQKGQYSHNSILDWSSAEIWLYIYSRGLLVNNAYKKGISRAGCLFCPMGSGKSDAFRYMTYPKEIDVYTDIIREMIHDKNIDSYISNGGWNQRRNARDFKKQYNRYSDEIKDGLLRITVNEPLSNWREWIKTIGQIDFHYDVEETRKGYIVKAPASIDKTSEGKYFKQVFHKAAFCVGCGVCEANCRKGCLSFKNGFRIDQCFACKECHNIEEGCLHFHSQQLPKEKDRTMKKSLNAFADHAPKMDWLISFFEQGDAFFEDNILGSNQLPFFTRFLSDARLVEKRKVTPFFDFIKSIGWESADAWAFILIQLCFSNAQFRWYISNLPANSAMIDRKYLEGRLQASDVSAKDSASIIKAFGRFAEETPLGTALNFGAVEKKGKSIVAIKRCKAPEVNPLVILYALYRYAEAEKVYQFTLESLMDFATPREGMSPAQIFGMTRDELEASVRGLSAKYPEYVASTFTHDLDKISLRTEHNADDILTLL